MGAGVPDTRHGIRLGGVVASDLGGASAKAVRCDLGKTLIEAELYKQDHEISNLNCC